MPTVGTLNSVFGSTGIPINGSRPTHYYIPKCLQVYEPQMAQCFRALFLRTNRWLVAEGHETKLAFVSTFRSFQEAKIAP